MSDKPTNHLFSGIGGGGGGPGIPAIGGGGGNFGSGQHGRMEPPYTQNVTIENPTAAALLWRQWAMQQAVMLVVSGHAPMSGIKVTADEILQWVKATNSG